MLKFNTISIIYIALIIVAAVFIEGYTLFIILISILYIATVAWGVSNIRSQMFIKTYNANPEAHNKVAISYDDGPHQENTAKILEILKKNDAKASFFLIGENIEKNKQMVKAIVDGGHLIGNHSYSHNPAFPFKLPAQIKKDLIKSQELIEEITGTQNLYFRPPFGVTNHFIARALSGLNLKVIGWTIRSLDTTNKDKEVIFEKIKKKLRGGDIILLHDKTRDICWLTEKILDYLEQNNFKTVTIEDLLFKH